MEPGAEIFNADISKNDSDNDNEEEIPYRHCLAPVLTMRPHVSSQENADNKDRTTEITL